MHKAGGHVVSWDQCDRKMKRLKQCYKKVKDHNFSGNGEKICPFDVNFLKR